jgi:4-hydroxy-tetrahydrodipicolinate synthase
MRRIEMTEVNIRGMVPAAILPMDKDYEPDYNAYRNYLEWLIDQNAVAFAVNMDTGEGPQLNMQERREVVRVAAEVGKGRVAVLAGLMGSTTKDAVSLAKVYKEAGADGVVVFPNAGFRNDPLDPRIPYNYHKAIADESGLPLVLFQLAPVFGGNNYSREALLKVLEIPQVIGIKEASFDLAYFNYTLDTLKMAGRDITVLTGNDRLITETLLLGADGALLGFAAIGCGLVADMIQCKHQGEYKTMVDMRVRVQGFADFIYADPVLDYRARCKAALARIGVIDESLTYVRPPLLPTPKEEYPAFDEALRKAGML